MIAQNRQFAYNCRLKEHQRANILLSIERQTGREGDILKVIELRYLTKDYGGGKGIFDVSLAIEEGEVYGYLGPNGAGKSTTIRQLMGFSRPDSGAAFIKGFECRRGQKEIQKITGYLPGEIAFPEDMTGTSYLDLIAAMRGTKDPSMRQRLREIFEINTDVRIRRMSKGMKQKLGLIAAFMHDPEILLLDEPTSGLDPIMQNRFIELIKEEQKRGKTILMSSHIFEEVERTCRRVGIIREGILIREIPVEQLRSSGSRKYRIRFENREDAAAMEKMWKGAEPSQGGEEMEFTVRDRDINDFILSLSKVRIRSLEEKNQTLEEYFMEFYGGDGDESSLL